MLHVENYHLQYATAAQNRQAALPRADKAETADKLDQWCIPDARLRRQLFVQPDSQRNAVAGARHWRADKSRAGGFRSDGRIAMNYKRGDPDFLPRHRLVFYQNFCILYIGVCLYAGISYPAILKMLLSGAPSIFHEGALRTRKATVTLP